MPRTGASEATKRIRQKDAPDRSIRGGVEHGPSPRIGSPGEEPGAANWSVRGNGERTSDRRPRLEHPGRSGAQPKPPDWIVHGGTRHPGLGHPGRNAVRHKPPDWIVRGGTRGHGLDHPRQRREYGKKTPRMGASGADRSKAQTPGLQCQGVHLVPRTGMTGDLTHPDWNVRGRGGP